MRPLNLMEHTAARLSSHLSLNSGYQRIILLLIPEDMRVYLLPLKKAFLRGIKKKSAL
jgi:hypothetical protein